MSSSSGKAILSDGTSILVNVHDGKILNNIPDKLMISGNEINLPDVAVKTTKKELEKCFAMMPNVNVKRVFINSWNAIKQFGPDDMARLYNEQGKDWQNLMQDIIIFYCARNILFGKPIPIIPIDQQ